MGALFQILNGPNGKASSMRMAMLAYVFTVMGTWSWVSVKKCELQPINPEIIAGMGMLAGAKVYQGKIESQPDGKPESK